MRSAPRAWAVAGLAAAILAAGCGERPRPGRAAAAEARQPAEGAMCREHGVVEALCARCNPALAAVFRAKGDWCAEHGQALSICPVHHPERHGRPERPVVSDEAPAEGLRVRFKTPELARQVGLRIVPAVRGPAVDAIEAPAHVVHDATRVALVRAAAAGVVRSVRADLGAPVAAGARLAEIDSAEVGAEASALQAASARIDVAQAALDRARRLRDAGVAPEREVLAAQGSLAEAQAQAAAARAALGVAGSDGTAGGRFWATAPIRGRVTRRDAAPGRVVGAGDPLFEIVDTSVMWAEVDVPEARAAEVAPGQRAVLRLRGITGPPLAGEIFWVAPEIDPHSRAARVRVALANTDGRLRANQLAEARIEGAPADESTLVPAAAVQRVGGVAFVFVRLAEDRYEVRRVRLGPRDGDRLAVAGAVAAGDDVVTEGSFLLKTETLRGSIGAGCCAVE